MVGRWQTKKTRSSRVRLEGQDRISQLHDSLICKILSCLPTKDVVKTSVLSTSWRNLWLEVPSLKFDSREFPDVNSFLSFGEKFFDSNRVSCINKLKLAIVEKDACYLTSWFSASDKQKIQHLHVKSCADLYFSVIPKSLYVFKSLVCLNLYLVALADTELVSLPCLKTMQLKAILYPNSALFERLVSSCPVLEELEISQCLNDNAIVFQVLSRSLKKLSIDIHFFVDALGSGVVIDAPQLRFLSISDILLETYLVKTMHPNAKLNLSLAFGLEVFNEASVASKRSSIHSFLTGILEVMDMTICRDTFKLLCQYSKSEPLPRFGYVSRLHINLSVSGLKWLPSFLESFPNLKSLILVCKGDYKMMMNQESLASVPECLPLSLEFVELQVPISGHDGEMKIVRYFLENSAVLKKLTLHLKKHSVREKSTLTKLLRIPRGSTKCEVEVL